MATPVRIPDELIAHRFLVVADIGINGDYKTEPRHIIELMLPRDDITTLTQEQAVAVEHSLRERIKGLPDKEAPLHVWHLDKWGTPSIYLNQELRQAPWNTDLYGMVTCPQQMHSAQIILRVLAEAIIEYECHGRFVAMDHWDAINSVIDTQFPGLCCTDYSDYSYTGGVLSVDVHGWASVTCQFPFRMTKKLTLTQIEHAIATACHKLCEDKPWRIPEDMLEEAWVVSDHEPTLNLLGLASVARGNTSLSAYQGDCRTKRRAVPRRLIAPRPIPIC